jgi:AcrR family transcriptional regulator
MAPDDRRAAIIAATVPLLQEHGLNVSTRQIAQAAGVAEGTLFGVFPDKSALIRAALLSVFDPEPVVEALGAIDPGLDLRGRLVAAMDILRERFERNANIVAALRGSGGPPAVTKEDTERLREFLAQVERSRDQLTEALAALIEPDRHLLRRSPVATGRSLFMLLMTSRSTFGDPERLDSAEVVSLLLDGLLVRPGGAPC